MKRIFLLAAAALGLMLPTSGTAAPLAANPPATGRALVLIPLTLTKIDDLDFGTVVPSGLSGAVSIDATTGARMTIGGVTGVASDSGRRAYFGTAGSPNQQVIVTLTAPLALTSVAGDTIPVLALTLDGPPVRIVDPTTRNFFFGVGGVILIGANQPEGIYTATFDVTATYL
jgi:Domain of unknown function (DUF4402)